MSETRIRISRRKFLGGLVLAAPAALGVDAAVVEPSWLKVEHFQLPNRMAGTRFVHFTDLHYKGDREFAEGLVRKINSIQPEFVCFTGDFVETRGPLDEALEILRGIKAPLFAVPGNHDYWAKVDFKKINQSLEKNGGALLMDARAESPGGKIAITGLTCTKGYNPKFRAEKPDIILMHYPSMANQLAGCGAGLLLAGHTHGGQVRLPFVGSIIVPSGSAGYDLGFFDTPGGRLYVGPGVGWFYLNLRLNCRPGIAVFET